MNKRITETRKNSSTKRVKRPSRLTEERVREIAKEEIALYIHEHLTMYTFAGTKAKVT